MGLFDELSDSSRDRAFHSVGRLISTLGGLEWILFNTIDRLQRDPVVNDCAREFQFDKRIALTKKLLTARNAPEALRKRFDMLAAAISPIMQRRAIVAHNAVTIHYESDGNHTTGGILNAKKWFTNPLDVMHAIEEVDKDFTTAR